MASHRKIPTAFSAVVILAAFAYGCGGSTDAASITKAQFVKRATAICEREHLAMIVDSDVYTNHHRHSTLSSGQLHLASIAASLPARLRNDIRLLRALGTPSGNTHLLHQFYAAEEQAIASHGHGRPTSLTQIFTWYRPPDRLATAYGILKCTIL